MIPVAEWVNEEQGFQYLITERLPEGTKLYACEVNVFSSRMCELGTKSCTVEHTFVKPKRTIHQARLPEDERLKAAEAWAEKFGGRDADGVIIFDQVSDVADMLDAFRGDK